MSKKELFGPVRVFSDQIPWIKRDMENNLCDNVPDYIRKLIDQRIEDAANGIAQLLMFDRKADEDS